MNAHLSSSVCTPWSSLGVRLDVLLLVFLFLVCQYSNAQPSPATELGKVVSSGVDKELSKVAPSVVELAKAGKAQQLMVVLEHSDIVERASEKRRNRRLPYNDEALTRETNEEFAKLKKEVFPGRRLGRVELLEDYSHAPVVFVLVPDWLALKELLTHPKVKAVHENRQYQPALSQSLPLIGQPSAVNADKRGSGTRVAILDGPVDVRSRVFSSISEMQVSLLGSALVTESTSENAHFRFQFSRLLLQLLPRPLGARETEQHGAHYC